MSYFALTTYAGKSVSESIRYWIPGGTSRRGPGTGDGSSPATRNRVLPLIARQHQRPGQRGQHLPRRPWPAALLEPDVVVDGQPGELRDLLLAQPGRAAALAVGQADVARAQPVPPGAQERRELGAVDHVSSLPPVPPPRVVPPVPALAGLFPPRRPAGHAGDHDSANRSHHRSQQGDRPGDREIGRAS